LHNEAQVVRITHPFHPLCGREFILLERRSVWGDERVYFHDDAGRLRRLPIAWSNIGTPDAFEVISAGRSHFRVEDLLQLVSLIDRQKGAPAAAPPPKRRKKCVK
jgi:hypothetical protein